MLRRSQWRSSWEQDGPLTSREEWKTGRDIDWFAFSQAGKPSLYGQGYGRKQSAPSPGAKRAAIATAIMSQTIEQRGLDAGRGVAPTRNLTAKERAAAAQRARRAANGGDDPNSTGGSSALPGGGGSSGSQSAREPRATEWREYSLLDVEQSSRTKSTKECLHPQPSSALYAPESQRLRVCLLYTSPSPRDATLSRMPSSA